MIFNDRKQAGGLLAKKLTKYKDQKETLILAIPRGALEIGYELHKALNLPLDVVITKKIGDPYNKEFAIGAVNSDGQVVLDEGTVERLGISETYIERQTTKITKAIKDKLRLLRNTEHGVDVKDKTIIVTDDGLATGFTMLAAVKYLKSNGAKKIIVAVPVGHPETIARLKKIADEVTVFLIPEALGAISVFYYNFPQVTDEEAKSFLDRAKN
ncbi:MAG: phosphoribosyltransferase [Candidatus Dojkabacteria bacterium]